MSMDRERGSYVAPGGHSPLGTWGITAAVMKHGSGVFWTVENHRNRIDIPREPDAAVIRLAISAMALHRAETALWDDIGTREERVERKGLSAEAAPSWHAAHDTLTREVRDLGRQLDGVVATLAQLVAVTTRGIAGKALVVLARDEVEPEPSIATRALRLSTFRDVLAMDGDIVEGGRADG